VGSIKHIQHYELTNKLAQLKEGESFKVQNSIGSKTVEITKFGKEYGEYEVQISNKVIYKFRFKAESVWELVSLLEELSCIYPFRVHHEM